MPADSEHDKPVVAVVLSGAGARGAFQAGALAEIVPALVKVGKEPMVWLGTSAGALNAGLYASHVHLGPLAAVDRTVEVWRHLNEDSIYERLLPWGIARTSSKYVTGFLGWGDGIDSLLDTTPLAATAEHAVRLTRMWENIDAGRLNALGVVATRMAPKGLSEAPTWAGPSTLFLDEAHPSDYVGDSERGLGVHRGRLHHDHLLASAAIPVAFPSVWIDEGDASLGPHPPTAASPPILPMPPPRSSTR